MSRSDAESLEHYRLIRDGIQDRMIGWSGRSPLTLDIAGSIVEIDKPTEELKRIEAIIKDLEIKVALAGRSAFRLAAIKRPVL